MKYLDTEIRPITEADISQVLEIEKLCFSDPRNEENIREIIAFPMSGSGQDLMCNAPNEVTELQLREVHIKVRD